MKFIRVLKAKENEEVVKQRLEELARLLDEEGSLSYGEINYLQDHQEEVKKYFPNNSTMWQWADIPESDWNVKNSSKQIKSGEWTVERRHSYDTEDGKEYYYIWGPDGEYCDADGNPYKFDSREDALEEVEYLKAEHKANKEDK